MKWKTQPREHQLDTFELGKDLDGWGEFWNVGSGKSYMAIMFCRWKFNLAGKILPTIIFTHEKAPFLAVGVSKLYEHSNDSTSGAR